jgi:cell division transport system permease protein
MRAGFIASEVWIGLRRNFLMTLAVMTTVAISLTLLGVGFLANSQVRTMKDYWYDKIQVSIYLCGNTQTQSCSAPITDAQRASILSDLNALPVVQTVYHETQAEAFQHFETQFKGTALAQSTTADQLPESYRIKLKDPTKYQILTSEFTGRPGVDSVQDEHAILDKFFRLLNVMRDFTLIIGIASVLTAWILISNMLRVTAFNRRREIGVMRLVGASSFSIQLPFVLEGMFSAFTGWLIATGLLAGFKYAVDIKIAPLLSFTRFFTWGDVAWASLTLILTGFVVSSLASFFTLRKHLRV